MADSTLSATNPPHWKSFGGRPRVTRTIPPSQYFPIRHARPWRHGRAWPWLARGNSRTILQGRSPEQREEERMRATHGREAAGTRCGGNRLGVGLRDGGAS
jgi:hypothetical protein